MPSSLAFRTSRALPRALALVAALAVLLAGGVAWAMPAPMCGERAQSIDAPFPILPSQNGEARATNPCTRWGSFELGNAPTPEHGPQTAADATIDRAPPISSWRLPRDRGRKLPPAEAIHLSLQPGFQRGVFRPPRAA